MGAFPRYLVSAGTATCVDVALVQLLLSAGFANSPTLYAVAIVAGSLCGMGVNFLISSRFVFASDARPTHQQFTSFLIIALTALLLRVVVAFALMAIFTLPFFAWLGQVPVSTPYERAAHIGAVGLVMTYSFLAHKHVSFAGGVLAFLANKGAVRP